MMMPLSNGLVHLVSPRTAVDTMEILEAVVVARGLHIMARIDHAEEAAKVSLEMPPTFLLLFGSPLAGTPVMVASPTVAIDLPLKVLVWQDHEGHVWISYNSPRYLQKRHEVPLDVAGNIAGIKSICEEVAHAALR